MSLRVIRLVFDYPSLSLTLSPSLSIYQLPGKWFALPLRSLNGFPQTAKQTDQSRPKYTVIFSLITLFCTEDEGGGQASGGRVANCHTPHREGLNRCKLISLRFHFLNKTISLLAIVLRFFFYSCSAFEYPNREHIKREQMFANITNY